MERLTVFRHAESVLGDPLKLTQLLEVLDRWSPRIAWAGPEEVTLADVVRVHDEGYAMGVIDGPPPSQPTGHPLVGTDPLKELGLCSGAALAALEHGVAAALTTGVQDAFWDSPGHASPFNGWLVAAARLLSEGRVERVALIDCSSQCGSGTQSIIDRHDWAPQIKLISFGRRFQFRRQAQLYLARVRLLERELAAFAPDIVFYQAAAGSHAAGPVGGVLGTDQMRRRDAAVFAMARRLGVPIAWNIDGGGSSAPPVDVAVRVHWNTFREAWWTFGLDPLG